jgi:hypothetical protein
MAGTALPTNRLGVSPTAETVPLGGPLGTKTTAVLAGGTSVVGWLDVGAWGALKAQLLVTTFGSTCASRTRRRSAGPRGCSSSTC